MRACCSHNPQTFCLISLISRIIRPHYTLQCIILHKSLNIACIIRGGKRNETCGLINRDNNNQVQCNVLMLLLFLMKNYDGYRWSGYTDVEQPETVASERSFEIVFLLAYMFCKDPQEDSLCLSLCLCNQSNAFITAFCVCSDI